MMTTFQIGNFVSLLKERVTVLGPFVYRIIDVVHPWYVIVDLLGKERTVRRDQIRFFSKGWLTKAEQELISQGGKQ